MGTYLLFETAAGYALFERLQSEDIGQTLDEVQRKVQDLAKFSQLIKLKSFIPFKSAGHALENSKDLSEGKVNEYLKSFLEMNLPKAGKKKGLKLGMLDRNLATEIKKTLDIDCVVDDTIFELIRGLRIHMDKMLKQFKEGDLEKAQLGLGHSYSRSKVQLNVNKSDNMIIQAIALLDQLDKDINTFSMRIREWYSWHFPEMGKIVNDNHQFAQLTKFIKNKASLSDEHLSELAEITQSEDKAKDILDAARSSMGTDISPIDLINIEVFAEKVISLNAYRKRLFEYLKSKMNVVAPNLGALIGEIVGARLIAHAGSLTNLSKYPASTLQILGAEKALFRALKTKGNTPKYGLIYHSSFIGRAGAKNKGRISRFLSNKCSIASRIDCFMDKTTTIFGEHLRQQVEERLEYFEKGSTPPKNQETMQAALDDFKKTVDDMEVEELPENIPIQEENEKTETPETQTPKKKDKKKKDKKAKKAQKESQEQIVEEKVSLTTTVEENGSMDVEMQSEEISKKEKKIKKKDKKEKIQENSTIEVTEQVEKTEQKQKKKKDKKKNKVTSA